MTLVPNGCWVRGPVLIGSQQWRWVFLAHAVPESRRKDMAVRAKAGVWPFSVTFVLLIVTAFINLLGSGRRVVHESDFPQPILIRKLTPRACQLKYSDHSSMFVRPWDTFKAFHVSHWIPGPGSLFHDARA